MDEVDFVEIVGDVEGGKGMEDIWFKEGEEEEEEAEEKEPAIDDSPKLELIKNFKFLTDMVTVVNSSMLTDSNSPAASILC
jgi:hypothetical protein